MDKVGNFIKKDDHITTDEEPDHDDFCLLEQAIFYLNAIVNDQTFHHLLNALVA